MRGNSLIMKMKPPSVRLIQTFIWHHTPSSRSLCSLHSPFLTHSSSSSENKDVITVNQLITEEQAISSQPQMLNNSHSLLNQKAAYHTLKKFRRNPQKALHFFHWACVNHGLKPNSMISGQLLRILANRRSVNYFWGFANQMWEQGCEIDSKDYLAVAMNFKRLNMMDHEVAWSNFFNMRRSAKTSVPTTVSNTVHALDVVLGLHKNLTHETVLYLLKKEERNPRKALNLFKWVTEKQEFKLNPMIYGLMLRILANRVTIKEFWDLTKKMFEEGCYLYISVSLTVLKSFKRLEMMNDAAAWLRFCKMSKNSSARSIVRDVVDVILRSHLDTDLVKKLGEIKFAFSENVVVGILMELCQYPFKALRFFCWVRGYRGYTHNALTYNTILRVLAQREPIKEFWSMVHEMSTAGHDLDIVTYIEITRYLQNNRMMKDAVHLFELMMDGLYKPQVQICTSLLWDILKADILDVDLVFRVVRKYEATGLALPKVIYDGILKSLMGMGRFDEAEKILGTMRNAGYEPDHISYKLIVYGFCKAGRLEEARKAFGEIEVKGWVPDKQTWMFFICGHYTAGEIDKALEYFNKMLEKKVEADPSLLKFMVNGFCSKRTVDSTYTVFTKLIRKPILRHLKPSYFNLIAPTEKG